MVRTRLTACRSTGHQHTSQLAPHDVTPPQLQESQPDSPQIMVPESLEAQDTPAEESEQQQGDDDEDDNEEYSPLSDSKGEKLYHDTDEREPYGVRLRSLLTDSMLCWYTWESPPHPSTGSRESHAQDGLSTVP
jgi:hypothetical protein